MAIDKGLEEKLLALYERGVDTLREHGYHREAALRILRLNAMRSAFHARWGHWPGQQVAGKGDSEKK